MLTDLGHQIREALSGNLPGENAHRKMAPANRVATREYLESLSVEPRNSAVLIVLYPSSKNIRTIFIKRPSYPGVHSGQIAFPGGKYEQEDKTLENTALREAEEEVGLPREHVSLLGNLSPVYIPPSNFLVTPYLGIIDHSPNLIPEVKEVDEIFTPDINELLDDSIVGEKHFQGSSGSWKIKAPYFDISGHSVWGATAMMVSELKEVLKNLPLINNG